MHNGQNLISSRFLLSYENMALSRADVSAHEKSPSTQHGCGSRTGRTGGWRGCWRAWRSSAPGAPQSGAR